MKKIWNLPRIDLVPLREVDERRPTLLVTSAPAWNAVKNKLRGLNVAAQVEVTEANTDHWDALMESVRLMPTPEIVYGVGGGLAADAAKYIAAEGNLSLTVVPTALSVDAFLTWASGIRKSGCVYYIETKPPDHLIIDFDVIAAAPASIRAAGITDVMSIATGSWDWKFAHECRKNPPSMEFIPWVYDNARSILNGVLDCAAAAGHADHEGLKTLLDCLCMEVQLCNQVGHARPEEGSEHYFAYAVENEMGHGLPHGDLIGPAILLIARLQGQDPSRFEKALNACNIPLHNISQDVIDRTMKILPDYCIRHNLAYGIAHTL